MRTRRTFSGKPWRRARRFSRRSASVM
jgi:hypothetical protein